MYDDGRATPVCSLMLSDSCGSEFILYRFRLTIHIVLDNAVCTRLETLLSLRHRWSTLEVIVPTLVRELRRGHRAGAHVQARRLNSKPTWKTPALVIHHCERF